MDRSGDLRREGWFQQGSRHLFFGDGRDRGKYTV